jgi:WD40 repeat protein
VFGLEIGGENLLQEQWQGTLSDYVTAIAWSPADEVLAASSAAGEVVLWTPNALTALETGTGESVDSIAFSSDGQFLAAGGQDGVRIWHLQGEGEQGTGVHTRRHGNAGKEDSETREHGDTGNSSGNSFNLSASPRLPLSASTNHLLAPSPTPCKAWVEQLAWSPIGNQLAFSLGRSVQIWDADTDSIAATLNFEASSVLGIQWRPDGQYLAVCGHRGVKIWNAQNWQDEPYTLDIRAASIAIAWSPDGKYLASGNLDRTLTVLEWNNPDPWMMRGFPGKIRTCTWSEPLTPAGAPLLAVSCARSIAVWEKQIDESAGWEARMLDLHEDTVQAIAFQPGTFLLASASSDGFVCLWQEAEQVAQILEGASDGFSCLAWHPQGQDGSQTSPLLAAGGQNGELLIWAKPVQK